MMTTVRYALLTHPRFLISNTLIMSISKTEAKQLLERLIFEDSVPQEWVQDVWDMSPMFGETAAKLFEVFEALVECCPEEKLEAMLQTFYQESFDEKSDRN
ncbi:MAG: hypothetical protein ACOC04_02255 [Halothece sp.]